MFLFCLHSAFSGIIPINFNMQTIKNLLQGIDTVIIRVSDIENAKKWYRQKLGLTSIWEDQGIKLVVFDTGSPVSITLWETQKPICHDRETASYPIFRTADAALLHALLQQENIDTGALINDEHVTYFFFYDPDGNVLEACQVPE